MGLLVTAMCALGAVLLHLSATSKAPAMAVNTGISRGDVIEAGDLRTVYVATDDPLVRIDHESAVVGKVAVVDLVPGTLVTPTLVVDGAVLEAGDGVVGLALDPGQYPTLGLAPGDRVNVVRSGEASSGTEPDHAVIARGATVFEVEDLASDRKLVSIQATEPDAEAVASAAGLGHLRLVRVAS